MTLDALGHPRQGLLEPREDTRVRPTRRQPRREPVQDLAEVIELDGLVGVEQDRPHAAPRQELDQPLLLQPRESLPDGRPADPQPLGERGLAQAHPRLQPPVEDGLAQALGGIVDEAPAPEWRHPRSLDHLTHPAPPAGFCIQDTTTLVGRGDHITRRRSSTALGWEQTPQTFVGRSAQ